MGKAAVAERPPKLQGELIGMPNSKLRKLAEDCLDQKAHITETLNFEQAKLDKLTEAVLVQMKSEGKTLFVMPHGKGGKHRFEIVPEGEKLKVTKIKELKNRD